MGTATMTASSARWCAREGSRGGNGVQGKRGRAGRLRAAAWRLHAWIGSKGEASSAKQEVAGALRARATPRLCLLAEEEEDKGGGGGLGRPGGGAGPATGKWPRYGSFSLSLLF